MENIMTHITIKLTTTEELLDEKEKLIKEIIDLMKKQARSNQRYAERIQWRHHRLMLVNKKLET